MVVVEEIQETKSILKSKTAWVAFISAASAFLPPVHRFIAENPELYGSLLSILFLGLRKITKGRVSFELP